MNGTFDYYQVLGAEPADDFAALKRAYYRRAKECHPDRFPGQPHKEEEFKRLVEAFDVLSDPLRRRQYDARFRAFGDPLVEPLLFWEDDRTAIMDSLADDILEELIVGNSLPTRTTLRTLMLDLERTEKFCLFREGKTLFYGGHVLRAARLFEKAIRGSPYNILYHYFLARSCAILGRLDLAQAQLEEALQIGFARRPPLRLNRMRQELDDIRRRRLNPWARWMKAPETPRTDASALPEDERLRRRLLRDMMTVAAERAANRRLTSGTGRKAIG